MAKKYDDYTREERVELIKHDMATYMSILTQDHLNQLLDALAKNEPWEDLGNTEEPATLE